MHLMLPFLVDTGLRITEACNLQREHVTFKDESSLLYQDREGQEQICKARIAAYRSCRLLPAGMVAVHPECEYVFTSKGGKKPITRHYPSEQFRAVSGCVGHWPRVCVALDAAHVLHSVGKCWL